MRPLIFVCLSLLLTGCGSLTRVTPPLPSFPLLAPATLGATRSVQQVLHATFGDQELVINSVVTATPTNLQVIAVNAVGLRLFSVDYDGKTVKAERAPGLPEQLAPERILADLQLACWPLKALQDAARGSEWQVGESTGGTRWLRHKDKLIAEVRYTGGDPWQSRMSLSNYQYGYVLAFDAQPLQ
jgi:hypothetical protein